MEELQLHMAHTLRTCDELIRVLISRVPRGGLADLVGAYAHEAAEGI